MTALIFIASAFITALTLVFPKLAFLSYFCIAPAIYLLLKKCETRLKKRTAYLYGFIWFFVYYFVIYHWFLYLYPLEFAGVTPAMGALIVGLCWLGLTLLQTVVSAFVFPIFALLQKHKVLSPLLFACIWTLFEYAQGLTWAGVPWARIALTQTEYLPMIQSAGLFGSLFLSFLVVLVNGYFALAFYSYKSVGIKHIHVRVFAGISACLLLLNFTFGTIKLLLHKEESRESFSAALIQGNVSSSDKWSLSGPEALELYIKLTYDASSKKKLDIVLWPETAINFSLLEYGSYTEEIKTLSKDTGAVIFVGTFVSEYDESAPEKDKQYNAIVAFFPDGTVENQPYYKRRPVPFGEYMPMGELFMTLLPPLASLNLTDNEISKGSSSAICQTEHGAFGRLVCFDSIYQELARKSTSDGAEVLLLSTNDSWYMDSSAVYQHNSHAQLRAVENNRWLLRAANTGISTVITSTGKTVRALAPLEQGYIIDEAYKTQSRSLYSYIGDVWVLLCLIFTLSYPIYFKIKSSAKGNS